MYLRICITFVSRACMASHIQHKDKRKLFYSCTEHEREHGHEREPEH
jgi:hypothetical protein